MSDINKFNSTRLTLARRRRGLNIKDLSAKVGITSRSLSSYENGGEPKSSTVSKLANQLRFREHFFFLDDAENIDIESASFRSLARMPAPIRDAAICAGCIALELVLWLEKILDLPLPDIPDLRHFEPEAAAAAIRNEWAIGEKPIDNVIHLLESKGVKVFSLVENTLDMDAFSFWKNNNPYLFLNTRKSAERSRFDAAHELGHIVLHKHGSPSGKEAESQANRFASAFLMSPGSIFAYAPRIPTLENILQIKLYWKVAASALVRRMKDLNIITDWQYRSLNIELSMAGGLKNELNPIPQREISKLWPTILKILREDGIKKENIANELGLYIEDIDALIFNLAMIGLKGKANSNTSSSKSNHQIKNHLRVIK
jgi:Zn-dependent peptidase ImmA (M78 family)